MSPGATFSASPPPEGVAAVATRRARKMEAEFVLFARQLEASLFRR